MALIIIGTDQRCTCSCAVKCIKNKTGSSARCTKKEIEEEGHHTIELLSKDDDRIIQECMRYDGDEKKLKLKLVRMERKPHLNCNIFSFLSLITKNNE